MHILLLLLLACDEGRPEPLAPEVFPEAAERTTFASSEALGAYVMEAHSEVTTTREGGPSQLVREVTRLRWQSEDEWQWQELREGELISEVRVWQGVAWRRSGNGELRRQADSASARADLTLSADPWSAALGTSASRVEYRDPVEEDIEGRKVWRYRLALRPNDAPGRRSRDVTRVEGQVWIDQATAVRLAGELTIETTFRSRRTSTQLRFAVTNLGGKAGVEPPVPEIQP